MIPPQGRMPVNVEQAKNALQLAKAEAELKARRVKTLEALSLAHRQWVTNTATQAVPPDEMLPMFVIYYTQALQDDYDAQLDLLRVDLSRTQAQVAIYTAMLEEAERGKLALQ